MNNTSMAADDDLPEVLARVAEACGRATALKLAAAFGGVPVYVPKRPTPTSPLARAIGVPAAEDLLKLFGEGWLTVPLGPFQSSARARAAVRKNLAAGMSVLKAARAAGVHIRTAWRIRSRTPMQPELPLFDRAKRR